MDFSMDTPLRKADIDPVITGSLPVDAALQEELSPKKPTEKPDRLSIIKSLLWAVPGSLFGFGIAAAVNALTGGVLTDGAAVSSGVFVGLTALGIGLFLGLFEVLSPGSHSDWRTLLNSISALLFFGFLSGYLADGIYRFAFSVYGDMTNLLFSIVRAVDAAIFGIGIGLAVGFTRPSWRHIYACTVSGLLSAITAMTLCPSVLPFGENRLWPYLAEGDYLLSCVIIVVMTIMVTLSVVGKQFQARIAYLSGVNGMYVNKTISIFKGINSIGSSWRNSVVICLDPLVSPRHCSITWENGTILLTDMGTHAGTAVNGSLVGRRVLKDGDSVTIGSTYYVFHITKKGRKGHKESDHSL